MCRTIHIARALLCKHVVCCFHPVSDNDTANMEIRKITQDLGMCSTNSGKEILFQKK